MPPEQQSYADHEWSKEYILVYRNFEGKQSNGEDLLFLYHFFISTLPKIPENMTLTLNGHKTLTKRATANKILAVARFSIQLSQCGPLFKKFSHAYSNTISFSFSTSCCMRSMGWFASTFAQKTSYANHLFVNYSY